MLTVNPLDNGAFTHTNPGAIGDTTDATPKTILSIPIGEEKVAYLEAYATTYELTAMNPGAAAKAEALFIRRSGGNVLRATAPKLTPIVTTFTAPQPAIDLVANTATQSVDVVVTGKAGVALRWYVEVSTRMTA